MKKKIIAKFLIHDLLGCYYFTKQEDLSKNATRIEKKWMCLGMAKDKQKKKTQRMWFTQYCIEKLAYNLSMSTYSLPI